MINKFLSIFGIHRVGMVVTVASQVIRTFEQEFQKDGDAKNAAIDAIVEILQGHKDAVPTIPPAPPAA